MNFNFQERVASQVIKTWFHYLTTVGQATGISMAEHRARLRGILYKPQEPA